MFNRPLLEKVKQYMNIKHITLTGNMKYKSKITQKSAARQQKSNKSIKWLRPTRFEQMNRTPQQIRKLYDHKSATYLLCKQRNTKSPYLSDRKLIKFLISVSVPTDKKEEASKDLFIYITPSISLTTKKIVSSNRPPTQIWASPPRVIPSTSETNEIISLIKPLATKHRWHFLLQTLKFTAYPLRLVQYGLQDYQNALQERVQVKSSYRYIKKVIENAMAREGLKPNWRAYYQERNKYLGVSVKPIATDTEAQPSYTAQAPKQERERSMTTVPAKVQPDLRYVVVNYAKRIWTELYKTNKPAFIIKRDIESRYRDYPQGQQEFNNWIKSEGKEFYEWYNENKVQ